MPSLSNATVAEFMSQTVITANLGDGLHQTWERMQERDIRHMPVLDDHERLAGIVSDRDIRRPDTVDVGTIDAFRLDDHMKVGEVMTSPALTVRGDTKLLAAMDLGLAKRFGALPVVDDDGRVLGMLSAYDLLRAARACV
jgi:acetoin utilization protein AcuB